MIISKKYPELVSDLGEGGYNEGETAETGVSEADC